ncbi:MAG: TolC family protein [Gammaproteobacteria bacterium]|nr:TolC family protein [Gammaproteobacteria bacterium]
MNQTLRRLRHTVLPIMLAGLAGCSSLSLEDQLQQANADTAEFTGVKLQLALNSEQREYMQQRADVLLTTPLSSAAAVELALINSPAFQAILARSWADGAQAAQDGRLPNPVFSFERIRTSDELEIGRALSLGLLDLILWPQRLQTASRRIDQVQIRLASEVVDAVTQVREAWVRAVAAQQQLTYARQIVDGARASAELARRLQGAGNFSRLERLRQHSFYAEATAQLAAAQQQSIGSREKLVRHLGLTSDQAQQLQLPERLPELPLQPLAGEALGGRALRDRLDMRLALAELDGAAREQGLEGIHSYTDVELDLRYDTVFDKADGHRSNPRGLEIALSMPVFDWGDLRRDALNARTLTAALNMEATARAARSHLREQYSAYHNAYDIARHYQQEILPLRQRIAEENLLRYNGMFISVFDLLSDAQENIRTVMAAMAAQEQFWLSDAALQSSLMGRPKTTEIGARAVNAVAADAH